jgi:protoheme IX farnesyltransferase
MLNRDSINDYVELTKPRIVLLVCITACMGFFMAPGDHGWLRLAWTLLGTSLASGGAAALNHCLERDTDRLMERTRNRPIPAGRVEPVNALALGVTLVLAGVFLLKWRVNLLTSFLVLLTAFLYVLVYTPLKKVTWLNTFIGSIPGALPPMVGWVASTGRADLGAYVLFLILFAWQHPHFYSLAWIYREDYARGGLKMLPVVDPSGRRTAIHVVFYAVLLLFVSALPVYFGMMGRLYLVGTLALGLGVLAISVRFARTKSLPHARHLFRASLVYFPGLLGFIIIDGLV